MVRVGRGGGARRGGRGEGARNDPGGEHTFSRGLDGTEQAIQREQATDVSPKGAILVQGASHPAGQLGQGGLRLVGGTLNAH